MLFNRNKLDDRSVKQKHSGQHGQNIYPKILCVLTHLNIKKPAKMCYSKHGIYHWKFNKYNLSDNGVQNLIFSGQYIITIEQK